MTFDMICNFQDFCRELRKAGFSLAGESSDGIFSLCGLFGPDIRWHTGDRETDPWAYRMRVLTEESDIGYGKFFLNKGGYMTREWAPCFIALKRQCHTFEEWYRMGRMSYLERNIMAFAAEKGETAFTDIKTAVGAKGLEAALTRLQTSMFLTISGQAMRLSKENVPYGWPVTTFRLTDDFWGEQTMAEAEAMSVEAARERILQRAYELNPNADAKALNRFLG